MTSLLAPDLVATVTNGAGGADEVVGAEAYLARMPDLAGAELSLRITQALQVRNDEALVMVEVIAQRHGRDLHNHAAFLAETDDGRITRLWMVDALPAESDEFWR